MHNVTFSAICGVLAFVFKWLNMQYLYVQFLLLMMWRALPSEKVRKELLVTGYPEKRCRTIEKYGVLFWDEYKKKSKIPIEMIRSSQLHAAGFLFFSAVLWTTGKYFFDAMELLFLGYTSFCVFVDIILLGKAYRIAFYKRFKRLSIHNFRHFPACSIFKAPPESSKMGKCIIIKEQNRFLRTYYIVKTKKSGNVYDKVMYCGGGACDKNRTYTLYEICSVRYII